MSVRPASALAANALPAPPAFPAPPPLHSGRRRSRHFIRPMATETSVGSREFNAVHEDNGRDVNPQQEDDDGGNRALDEREARVARDVPGEAVKRDPPQDTSERRANPHVAKAGLRVRNEVKDEADAEDENDRRGVTEGPRLCGLQPMEAQEHDAEPRQIAVTR